MWIFLPFGFFSITKSKLNEQMQVRARVREDLDELRGRFLPELGPTVLKAGTDYPYRAFVDKQPLAVAMARIALDIDYSNFKQTVEQRQGLARELLYSRVWSVMLGAERKLKDLDESIADKPVLRGDDPWPYGSESLGLFEGYGNDVPSLLPRNQKKQRGVRGGKRRKA